MIVLCHMFVDKHILDEPQRWVGHVPVKLPVTIEQGHGQKGSEEREFEMICLLWTKGNFEIV